jgi:phosphate/sulfate permease
MKSFIKETARVVYIFSPVIALCIASAMYLAKEKKVTEPEKQKGLNIISPIGINYMVSPKQSIFFYKIFI